RGLPGRDGHPGHQQRLVLARLPRRAGVRPDLDGPAGRLNRLRGRRPRRGTSASFGEGTPMHGRGSLREILVGLVVVVTLVGLLALLGLAGGGPGFLSSRRTIDVVFRDGQGIRVGCPVRVAGLDAGRVVDINLTEIEGTLWARVRIALPTALANKLRQ